MILVALFGIWRLMQGPIGLNWATPYVETAFDRSGIGLKVAVSGVRIGIDRNTHQLDLRTENVRVSLPGGEPLASFPEMTTSFALGALLRGRLAPTQVIVERPLLHLVRDAGGTISARIGAADEAAPDLGPQMLEQLAGPRQRDAPLGLLRRLDISGATVIVDDRRSGHTWRADRVDFAVRRSAKGVRGDFSLAVPIGNSLPALQASYRYFADRQVLDLALSIDGVQPAAIPPLIPELAALQHVDAAVSGTLRTRINFAQHRAEGSRLDLTLGPGRLHSEWLPTGSLAIAGGELHAVYAPETSEIRLDSLALDLGGDTRLALQGVLGGITPEFIAAAAVAAPPPPGHVRGTLNAVLTHVPVARLGELWPTIFSRGGRRWVLANITQGILDKAQVQLDLDLDPAAHAATVLNASGGLRYHDLTINYFEGLPPVHAVAGKARFAGDHLDFTPSGGALKGLTVTGGTLRLTDLGAKTEWLTVDLGLDGPLRDVLEVIDSKPLRFVHAIGLDPGRISGRAVTQLHFKLPLLADLKADAIEYAAKATITGASLGKVAFGHALNDGDLALDLSHSGAHLRGTARFGGIPGKLDAHVLFHPKSGAPRTTYRVDLTLDDAAQKQLGLDVAGNRVSGPVGVDVSYAAYPGGRGAATALLNLRDAALAIPEAGWKKPPGQPATAKLVVALDNDSITQIPQIEVAADGLAGSFAARLAADHTLAQIQIKHLAIGDSELSGTVAPRPAGGWRADIHAARADAQHLIKEDTTSPPTAQSAPLLINARIDQLILGSQRQLHQVSARLLRTDGIWQSGQIAGHYANGHQLSLVFGADGGHRLVFKSDDLGAALQLLGVADGVVGGDLTIEGLLSEVAGRRTLHAHLEGDNYRLVRTPLMARLLALPSLTGIASMLSGSALPFSTLRGDFIYNGDRLTLVRLLAFGEALGVTANGWVDLDRDRLELQGTVAPAYLLNSILGNVPVIGKLLGGGSQGLFAANYRLSGPSGNPRVTVNPLSALAPGVLRQLFSPITGLPPPPLAGKGAP